MLITIYYVIMQKTKSPGKSEEDVKITFCKSQEEQKHWKIPVLVSLLKKV